MARRVKLSSNRTRWDIMGKLGEYAMATLVIDDAIARQLQDIAGCENRSIDEILASLLARYTANRAESEESPPNLLLMLAEAAEKLGLRSGREDISSRSREILNTEWPDYLRHRRDSD